MQLHPAPSAEDHQALSEAAAQPSSAPSAAGTAAAPAAGGGAQGGLLTMLQRIDNMDPPVVVVGVVDGEEDAHLAAVLGELEAASRGFVGRAVLLVPQRDGVDAPVRRSTRLSALLAQAVSQAAAATLVYRGPDDQGRDHFLTLHSAVPRLPPGATFADPRPK